METGLKFVVKEQIEEMYKQASKPVPERVAAMREGDKAIAVIVRAGSGQESRLNQMSDTALKFKDGRKVLSPGNREMKIGDLSLGSLMTRGEDKAAYNTRFYQPHTAAAATIAEIFELSPAVKAAMKKEIRRSGNGNGDHARG